MSDIQLSNGAVTELMRGVEIDSPVFQILGFKKIAGQGGSERYRLNISDGIHCHTFAMLATQHNNMVPEGKLDMYSVIRCDKVISNSVNEKKVLIILELTVLRKGADLAQKIGNPVQWTEENANLAGAHASAVQHMNGNGNISRPAVRPSGGGRTDMSSFYGGATNNGPQAKVPRMAPQAGNASYGVNMAAMQESVVPIRDITPFNNKITIRARITKKTPVRHWSNAKGEGKLFSIDLLDDGGEIRMTGFSKAVDDYYDMLEVEPYTTNTTASSENQVYYIKNFAVKAANRAYSNLNHDYEISFAQDTQVVPCLEDASDIPNLTFNFVDIANIEVAEPNSIIDVIGICKNVADLTKFIAKTTNKELTKRDITLVDKSNREIQLTLWGQTAESFNDDTQPVVAAKGVKVSDFSGRSLSLQMNGTFQVNPDIREAHILRGWYDNEGSKMETQSLSTGRAAGGGTIWKVLREANDASELGGDPNKADYFMSKVAIMSFKRDQAMYKACSNADCRKKVVDNNNGLYRCEKCQKEYTDFRWRIMLQVDFADFSDHVWATCFQETGEQVLGADSETLGKMNTEEPDKFEALLKEVLFTNYIVKFRSKMESFNGENRLKFTVVDLHAVKFHEYAKQLLADIKETAGI